MSEKLAANIWTSGNIWQPSNHRPTLTRYVFVHIIMVAKRRINLNNLILKRFLLKNPFSKLKNPTQSIMCNYFAQEDSFAVEGSFNLSYVTATQSKIYAGIKIA